MNWNDDEIPDLEEVPTTTSSEAPSSPIPMSTSMQGAILQSRLITPGLVLLSLLWRTTNEESTNPINPEE